MKHLALICAIGLSAAPVTAQDSNDLKDGVDLLSEGTQLLLRGLMGEIEPTLRELEGALNELDLSDLNLKELDLGGFTLGDLNAYHAPEILPNGDIIIRRKRSDPVAPDPETGEIEL